MDGASFRFKFLLLFKESRINICWIYLTLHIYTSPNSSKHWFQNGYNVICTLIFEDICERREVKRFGNS